MKLQSQADPGDRFTPLVWSSTDPVIRNLLLLSKPPETKQLLRLA